MSNVFNLIRAEGITGEKKVFDRDLWDEVFSARQNGTIIQMRVTGVEVHILRLKAGVLKDRLQDEELKNKPNTSAKKKPAGTVNDEEERVEVAIPCLVMMHGHIKGLIPVQEAGMDSAVRNLVRAFIKFKRGRSQNDGNDPVLSDKDMTEIKKRALSTLIGQLVAFKVIGIIEESDIFLASRKQAIEVMQKITWDTISAGEVRTAVVRKVSPRSCILDIGGVLTRLDKKDMSWGWVYDTRSLVEVGDNIDVKVLSVDRENKTVRVSLKELRPKPWPDVLKRYQVGSTHLGTVAGKQHYGIFVNMEPGFDVLCKLRRFDDVEVGDWVSVKIFEMNQEKEEARGIIVRPIKRVNRDK
jgi:ribosomal protein S1